MHNYFRGTLENPYHISIGGLVVNDEGNVLVHHFKNKKMGTRIFDDLYLLLRETIEPNETIEQTLARGLMEEFGAHGELVKYLGSIKGTIPRGDAGIEKTTLYFLVKYLRHDDSKREEGSSESESELEWHDPTLLIGLFEKQAVEDASLDESVIVRRYLFE